jgi:hypothetical protein
VPSCSSLASLIPAEASREVRAIRAVGPALGATTHPVVGFATGPWEDMPPLVVNTEARSLQGSVVPLVSTQEGVPALVMASGGHRRLAWLNSGTLWRWFLGEHGTVLLAQGLVERLIAWLGQSGGPVRLNLSQAADALVAEVQVYDLDWRPLDGCLPELTFSDSSGNLVADLDLGAVVGAEGFYRGRTGPLPPGRLRYDLVVRTGETAIGRNQGWVNVEATDRERATAVACTGVLREIARVSGGRYYGFADAAAWIATLSRLGVHRISLCPWRGGWWALLALILLCGEWYLRRRIGLP